MLKFTNIVACIIAAGIFGMLAKGEIDQDLLRSGMLYAYWFPCAWFAVVAFINLCREG